jgi:hypothetical protein
MAWARTDFARERVERTAKEVRELLRVAVKDFSGSMFESARSTFLVKRAKARTQTLGPNLTNGFGNSK